MIGGDRSNGLPAETQALLSDMLRRDPEPAVLAAAAEEPGPVGLDLRFAHGLAFDDGKMGGPDFGFAGRAPPPLLSRRLA